MKILLTEVTVCAKKNQSIRTEFEISSQQL